MIPKGQQNLRQPTEGPTGSPKSLSEVSKWLERKTLDSPPYEYPDREQSKGKLTLLIAQRQTPRVDAAAPNLQ